MERTTSASPTLPLLRPRPTKQQLAGWLAGWLEDASCEDDVVVVVVSNQAERSGKLLMVGDDMTVSVGW